jgi:hypothetical protein
MSSCFASREIVSSERCYPDSYETTFSVDITMSSHQDRRNSGGLIIVVVSSGECFYNSCELMRHLEGSCELTAAVSVSSEWCYPDSHEPTLQA